MSTQHPKTIRPYICFSRWGNRRKYIPQNDYWLQRRNIRGRVGIGDVGASSDEGSSRDCKLSFLTIHVLRNNSKRNKLKEYRRITHLNSLWSNMVTSRRPGENLSALRIRPQYVGYMYSCFKSSKLIYSGGSKFPAIILALPVFF